MRTILELTIGGWGRVEYDFEAGIQKVFVDPDSSRRGHYIQGIIKIKNQKNVFRNYRKEYCTYDLF